MKTALYNFKSSLLFLILRALFTSEKIFENDYLYDEVKLCTRAHKNRRDGAACVPLFSVNTGYKAREAFLFLQQH